MPFVSSVYYDDEYIYMYRLGRNGQSMDIRSMQRNRAMHMKVLNAMLAFYDKLPEVTDEKKSYIEKVIGQMVETYISSFPSFYLQSWDCKSLQIMPFDDSAL